MVKLFKTGELKLRLNFPHDQVCCARGFCPMCRFTEGIEEYRCMATFEVLEHPFEEVGAKCPIVFDEMLSLL